MDQANLYNIAAQLSDIIAGDPKNMRARALAEKLRKSLAMIEDFFVYQALFSGTATAGNAGQLTAGATATFQINIQADSDFKILAGTQHASVANTAQTFSTVTWPQITVLLTDQGSGRNLMDNPVDVASMFGTGQLPFFWPTPKILSARSTLQVQCTSYESSQTTNLRLYFIGVKLFPIGG
jgi:hypothetical protein